MKSIDRLIDDKQTSLEIVLQMDCGGLCADVFVIQTVSAVFALILQFHFDMNLYIYL
jgi:hypothetical protein